MAQREALRDLQTRLAERLQAARTEDARSTWLAVEAGGAGFLFPLQQAGEIFTMVDILPLAHAQPWFSGVANLRGGLHGVVDLARFLGLREGPVPEGAAREQARLIAINPALRALCALRVDHMTGLRHAEELTAVPVSEERPAFAPRQWRDTGGQLWQEIDLAELVADGAFLSIAAPQTA